MVGSCDNAVNINPDPVMVQGRRRRVSGVSTTGGPVCTREGTEKRRVHLPGGQADHAKHPATLESLQ